MTANGRPLRVLYLTNNANLGSTARILQSWLVLGRQQGLTGVVVGQRTGRLTEWLAAQRVPYRVDSMPWPDRAWPLPYLWHTWRIARWAHRTKAQIMHCNEHNVYPFTYGLRKLLRIPVVCHVRYALERGFARWAFGGKHRLPDALLWTSHQQKADSAGAVAGIVPEGSQHVVYLGIDPSTFRNGGVDRDVARREHGISSNEVVIGTASPMRPRKRLEDFVALIVEITKRHPEVVGLIAGQTVPGDEAYADRIAGDIVRAGLGTKLRWLGNVERMERFYEACDIVVSTSEYETFGNSVCEAMACGRPVVAYRGGSVHEVVGEAGIIVADRDLQGLIGATEGLLGNATMRRDLGEGARRRVVECFQPSVSLQQVRTVYEELLRARERGE